LEAALIPAMDHSALEPPRHAPPPPAEPRERARRAPAERAPDTYANVRRAGAVMLIALALMGMFNSAGLKRYARDLPEGWLADEIVIRADQWHELMLALGPAHVEPALREAFEQVRALAW
jgi:hypothetical protein